MTEIEATSSLLIVDDNPVNIHVLIEAIGDRYDTRFALNGNDALEMASQTPPDLVLLDVQMPGMSGYEVCKRLKADPLLKDIPVIFLTAMSQQEDEISGFELGAADYITKPFNMNIVRLRIQSHLELKRSRDMLAKRTRELQEALDNIKVLKEIIPICMYCRKIRNDEGYWNQLEQYIREQTDSEFSHGICPDCFREYFGDDMADRVCGQQSKQS